MVHIRSTSKWTLTKLRGGVKELKVGKKPQL
jgi:hypothetical protein